MRLIIRKTEEKNNEQIVEFTKGALLSNVLRKEGVFVDMPCSGMGRCGKCRVKFLEGATAITDADRRFFSEKELDEGYRLSCRAVLMDDASVELVGAAVKIVSGEKVQIRDGISVASLKSDAFSNGENGKKIVAIDIGTTTIAASLVGSGVTVTGINHQRSFGSDVISRIQAAVDGNADELRRLILDDIKNLVGKALLKAGIGADTEPGGIVIAGNTTMLHLLMGDSCEGLGKAPYKPVRLFYPEFEGSEVFGFLGNEGTEITDADWEFSNAKVKILPCISAYVGADIVSGMYALNFGNIPDGKTYMLIDLGTNGEMAIAGSERILVASTAAGPVFEGGSISCGMPGVEGAIEHVTMGSPDGKDNNPWNVTVQTIGNAKSKGVCGSGVLELVSELRRCGIIDETGLLSDEYFDKGFPVDEEMNIYFLQDDIRAVQLAKAAIRSGIDTLLGEYGITAAEVDGVYLAGGFSEHMDAEKIRCLNLFPEEFLQDEKIKIVGNTSLLGCEALAKGLMEYGDADEALLKITGKTHEVVLSNEEDFSEAFLDNMNF